MNRHVHGAPLGRAIVFACLLAISLAVTAQTSSKQSTSVAANVEGSSASSATPASAATDSNTGVATPGTESTPASGADATTGTSVDAALSSASSLDTTISPATFAAGDTVYLKITPPVATPGAKPTIPLPAMRIFILDRNGVLELPYIDRFPLAGLSEDEAILRLRAAPVLDNHVIELRRLPVAKTGVDALEPLGYHLLLSPTTFAPSDDVLVPDDYVIGPNDTIVVQLYGTINETYTLPVARDGAISIPEIGPLQVAGLSYSELKRKVGGAASTRVLGARAHVTMGPLRSITVFIMGDVTRPGSYTVSALSTMTNALFVGGGVQTTGSLRDIQLKRSGRVVTHFDLYDMLLRGDTSRDARLRNGDVIFVPPISRTVSVSGEVSRPAIYELRRETSIGQVVELAGGLLPTAYPKGSQLQRVSDRQFRVLEDIDLSNRASVQAKVRDGDVLIVPALLDRLEKVVKVSGYVRRPGMRAWRDGMKLTDLVGSVNHLLPKPDLDYGVLRRHVDGMREIEVLPVRLGEAFVNPGGEANLKLLPQDELVVFGHEVVGDRQIKLAPIVAELERQATRERPARVVSIGGAVIEPGAYPLEAEMRVSDLLRSAGSLRQDADSATAELTRYSIAQGGQLSVSHIGVDLGAALRGAQEANLVLQPKDFLNIKIIQDWGVQSTVELAGEVRNPGIYPIARGEKLTSVIARAGGLTDVAFPRGAVFTRVELQEKEEALYKELADRLEAGMKTTLLERVDEAGRPQEAAEIARSVVDLLRNAKSSGRFVIDLPELLTRSNPEYDLTLMAGDIISIPQRKDEVTVVGEVRKATTHLFAPGKSVDDYLAMSGGLTEKGKRKLVFVIRANGAAVGAPQSFFGWGKEAERGMNVQPGDTVVAMLDVEKVSKLKVWRDVVGSLGGLGSFLSGVANTYTAVRGQKIIQEGPTTVINP